MGGGAENSGAVSGVTVGGGAENGGAVDGVTVGSGMVFVEVGFSGMVVRGGRGSNMDCRNFGGDGGDVGGESRE